MPAKNIQQDFVKKEFLETERWLAEADEKLAKIEKFDMQEDIKLRSEFSDRVLAHIVDIFYLGDEKKAWRTFDNYLGDEEIRAEIKKRLRQSKFYQALKKSS